MCDNDEAINNQKQWGKGHILLTRATLGELVLHLGKSLSGGCLLHIMLFLVHIMLNEHWSMVMSGYIKAEWITFLLPE